jgi:hypothetical protein
MADMNFKTEFPFGSSVFLCADRAAGPVSFDCSIAVSASPTVTGLRRGRGLAELKGHESLKLCVRVMRVSRRGTGVPDTEGDSRFVQSAKSCGRCSR